MRLILPLFIIVLTFLSCKKENSKVNLHHDYFGNVEGKYVVYNVKEISHLSDGTHDTIHYHLKTVIGDTVYDNAGRLGNKFFRYTRPGGNGSWALKDVWYIIIADNKGELIEENERIVKMIFAPTEDKKWDGNIYNTLESMQYSYSNIHMPFSIGSFSLDSTVTVVQEDAFNMIQYRKKYEVYAKGIGLVKKHYQHLNINNFNVSNISTGKELFYNMIQFGVE